MKPRLLMLFCILCLAGLVVLGSCATMKSQGRMMYERFCGTWANPAYEPEAGKSNPFAKIVVNPDGTYLGYQRLDQAGPTGTGFYTVEKRWTDAEGNSWYKAKIYFPIVYETTYELSKLDRFNAVWESQSSNNGYPTKIDPKDYHSYYRIRYRY